MQDWTRINEFADGEISVEAKAEIENALRDDPQIKREYTAVLQIKQLLATKCPPHACEDAWSRCSQRLREIERTEKTESIVWKYGYAVAAMLVIAIVSAAYLQRINGIGSMNATALASTLNASVAGGGSGRLDGLREFFFTERIPSPSAERLTLRQMDSVVINNEKAARLIYSDGRSEYMLLIAPGIVEVEGDPVPGYPGFYSCTSGRLTVVCWRDDDMGFALAAEKPLSELIRLLR
jgi:hypothetical protein